MGVAKSRRIIAAERKAQALTLALAEASYQQIADQIGVTRARAHQIVKEALAEIAAEADGKARTLRSKTLGRNNRVIQNLYTRALKGDIKAADAMHKLQDQNAKLTGAFAPTKVAPTDPTGEQTYQPKKDMAAEEREQRIAELLKREAERDGRGT